jgi:hypothetical protein
MSHATATKTAAKKPAKKKVSAFSTQSGPRLLLDGGSGGHHLRLLPVPAIS